MRRQDNVFTETAVSNVESNQFDLSHDVKLSFQMGELIPVNLIECLPGDEFRIGYVNMLRFAPLISPVMHRIKVKTEYFFIPVRILWSGWEDFITGNSNSVPPFAVLDDVLAEGTIADYLGIPPGDYSNHDISVSVLPLAAYLKVYDDWYRDQNLQSEEFEPLTAGDNTSTYNTILAATPLRRAWEHDYFTSCLPTSQQGAEVELPLVNQGQVPVEVVGYGTGTPHMLYKHKVNGTTLNTNQVRTDGAGQLIDVTSSISGVIDPNGALVVDIQADAATINDLREAFSLQAFLERTIRGGARYIEQMWSHFRTKSSDARLQRPEMIGSSVQNMVISEVLSTAQETTANLPIGTLAGHGISTGGNGGIYYKCEEHGFILGLMSVVPDTGYQDGLHRMFSRFDRIDYAWPSFAHIGEQEVRNKEIQAHDLSVVSDPEGIFGYIPRYSEYRFMNSRVAGEMRTSLDFWHLNRIFDGSVSEPALNEAFIQCTPDLRIFAVTSPESDHLYCHVMNKVSVSRKLPRFGIPSTL